MNLRDKTILVTGASSGIGQAIAIACASKGAKVLINFRKNEAGANETLAKVNMLSKGHIFQADLTDPRQIGYMFKEIAETAGAIDMVVNNAGDAQPGDFFDNESWKAQFDNIFFSALYVSQHFLKQNTGAPLRKIINVTSYYGNLTGGNTGYFSYSTAKAALNHLTTTLAKTDPHVLVNAVAPGYTMTPAWEGVEEEVLKDRASHTMINRYISSDEVAHITVALLENDAMTGQVIDIDGGLGLQKVNKNEEN